MLQGFIALNIVVRIYGQWHIHDMTLSLCANGLAWNRYPHAVVPSSSLEGTFEITYSVLDVKCSK